MGYRTCANPCQRCPDPRGKSKTCLQGEYKQSHQLWLLYLLGFIIGVSANYDTESMIISLKEAIVFHVDALSEIIEINMQKHTSYRLI